MTPNLSDIYYFQEVASCKNLSRAAERLGVTQPSISVAMKRLESALDCDLLIRSKTGITLTKAGKEFLVKGRHLINQWESLKQGLSDGSVEPIGKYRLGCHPSVGMYTLPYFVTPLMEKYPKLEIKLTHDHSRIITERVISFELDFGFVVNPVRHPDLVIKDLCVDLVQFWVKTSARQKVLEKNVIICDPALTQTQKMLGQLKKKFSGSLSFIESGNLELVAKLTAEGVGMGVIPTRVAGLHAGKDIVPLQGYPNFKDKVCLVYRHESRANLAFQKIVDEIVAVDY